MSFQITGTFDANQFEPNQGGSIHPVGRFPFTITNTEIKSNKDNTGGYLEVELTTPAGVAQRRYSLWPPQGDTAEKTKEIAHGQLSALCRAVGRYVIRFEDQAAALRGGQGMVEIGWQKGNEPSAEKPNGGYTEPKKFFDSAGNDPAGSNNASSQAQQPQNNQQQPPMTNQGGGNWGNQNQPQNNNNNPPQGQQQQSWNNNNQPQQNTQQQSQQNGGNWQQGQQNNGGGNNTSPPWGSR